MKKLLSTCLLALCLNGCGTIHTFTDQDANWTYESNHVMYYPNVLGPFSGTEFDYFKLKLDGSGWYALDVPFSFIADTVLFPFTFPYYLLNH